MKKSPFFSIITATRNDAWSLVKTMRSVFEQSIDDFEYIVVDGGSSDGSGRLIQFWKEVGIVHKAVSEPDTGVYNAMNKGMRMARGAFVCFLNAGDVFSGPNVLDLVRESISSGDVDGLLGWGGLNDQYWASWTEDEAFKLASLGFCHQSLFIRRELLLSEPFDERPFKTDSDTRQIGRLYSRGAKIPITYDVLSIRGGEPGISANLERTGISIRSTMTEEYPGLTDENAALILEFRRKCAEPEAFLDFFRKALAPLNSHLARMVLDTMFLRQSKALSADIYGRLVDHAFTLLSKESKGRDDIARLISAQRHRAHLMDQRRQAARSLDRSISAFEEREVERMTKLPAAHTSPQDSSLVVSLTTFPGRLKTLDFVLQSLLRQTYAPKEIHVCLAKEEVPNERWLPKRLIALRELNVYFHFMPHNYRQYNKFLQNFALNADAPFVIVDDDTIYPPGAFEYLYKAHRRYPEAIIGNRCHMMALTPEGDVAPYREWPREVQLPKPSQRLFHTGVGGVLYPPGFLNDPMVSNIDDILEHAPYADDVWLKVCAMAKGVRTFATELSRGSDWYIQYTPTMQFSTLMGVNVERGLNDVQVDRCLRWLSDIRPSWREELLVDEVSV